MFDFVGFLFNSCRFLLRMKLFIFYLYLFSVNITTDFDLSTFVAISELSFNFDFTIFITFESEGLIEIQCLKVSNKFQRRYSVYC